MRRNRILIGVAGAAVVGLALGTWACADRATEAPDEPDDVPRIYCERNFAKLRACDLPVEKHGMSERELIEGCAGKEWTWSDVCRDAWIARFDCSNALTCEEFAIHGSGYPEPGQPCYAEAEATGACYSDWWQQQQSK